MLTRGPPESPWQESLPGAAAQSILPVIWDHVCVVDVVVVVVDVVDVDNLWKRSRFWKSKKTTHVSATVGSRSRGALAGGIKIIIWNICWFDMSGKSGEKYRGVSEVEVPTVWDCISSIIGSSIYLRVSHSVHRHLHQLAGKFSIIPLWSNFKVKIVTLGWRVPSYQGCPNH